MSKGNYRTYRRSVWILMAIYVALMLLEWPYARSVQSPALKVVLALLPALPVIALIVSMGWRVVRSDELEQRVHMIALGVATGIVASLTLVGGFLAGAGAIRIGGDVLIWVFPALSVIYGSTHVLLMRRYGGAACEE